MQRNFEDKLAHVRNCNKNNPVIWGNKRKYMTYERYNGDQ